MKKVTIPTCANPFVVIVNGIKYTYPAGETVEVPDDVAEVIEQHEETHNNPKPDPVPPPYSGGVKSWNDLEDKPFGDFPITTNTINWNGKSDIVVDDLLYYVSEFSPTAEQLVGCSVVDENGDAFVVTAEVVMPMVENLLMVMLSDTLFFVVTSADNVSADGLELPKKGIYFTSTIKSATFLEPFEVTETVAIDPKYVPAELPEITAHTLNGYHLGVVDKKWTIVQNPKIKMTRVTMNLTGRSATVRLYLNVIYPYGRGLDWSEILKYGIPMRGTYNVFDILTWDYIEEESGVRIYYIDSSDGCSIKYEYLSINQAIPATDAGYEIL